MALCVSMAPLKETRALFQVLDPSSNCVHFFVSQLSSYILLRTSRNNARRWVTHFRPLLSKSSRNNLNSFFFLVVSRGVVQHAKVGSCGSREKKKRNSFTFGFREGALRTLAPHEYFISLVGPHTHRSGLSYMLI